MKGLIKRDAATRKVGSGILFLFLIESPLGGETLLPPGDAYAFGETTVNRQGISTIHRAEYRIWASSIRSGCNQRKSPPAHEKRPLMIDRWDPFIPRQFSEELVMVPSNTKKRLKNSGARIYSGSGFLSRRARETSATGIFLEESPICSCALRRRKRRLLTDEKASRRMIH